MSTCASAVYYAQRLLTSFYLALNALKFIISLLSAESSFSLSSITSTLASSNMSPSQVAQSSKDVEMKDATPMRPAPALQAYDPMDITPVRVANRESNATSATLAMGPPITSPNQFGPLVSGLRDLPPLGRPQLQSQQALKSDLTSSRLPNRPLRERVPLISQGPAQHSRRTANPTALKLDNHRQTLKATASTHRLSPLLSSRVLGNRHGGRYLLTSRTNRDKALTFATSNLFAGNNMFLNNGHKAKSNAYSSFTFARPLGMQGGRVGPSNDNWSGPSTRPMTSKNSLAYFNENHSLTQPLHPSGLNNAPFSLGRKRPFEEDESGPRADNSRARNPMLTLCIDPPEVRKRNKERLFGIRHKSPVLEEPPENNSSTEWTPNDQLRESMASATGAANEHIPGGSPSLPSAGTVSQPLEHVTFTEDVLREGELPLMSGALPPTGTPRDVVPISPDGTVIPAEYSIETQGSPSLRRVAAQDTSLIENAQPMQIVQPADNTNWLGWYIDGVAKAFTYAFAFAGAVKRHAASLFVRPRRATPLHPIPTTPRLLGPRSQILHGYSGEDRRRIVSDQRRRDRGLLAPEVTYPFPDITFDIPRFPIQGTASRPPLQPSATEAPTTLLSPQERFAPPARPVRASKITEEWLNDRTPLEHLAIDTLLARRDVQRKKTKKKEKRSSAKRKAAKKATKLSLEDESPLVPDLAPHLSFSPASVKSRPAKKAAAKKKSKLFEQPPIEEPTPTSPFNPGEAPEFPFGPAVSAVRLFSAPRPLPPGRTESVYAPEWREVEERRRQEERPPRVRLEGRAVRPLPEGWDRRLADAMALPNGRQVATSLSGEALTRRDLATCYAQNTWLNDEVINAYLSLLVDHLRRSAGNAGRHDRPLYHAFSSFFFSNLRDRGYQHVRRWAQRAKIGGPDLLNVDTVFIPVHNHNHWTLMVVKPSARTIEHFDSLGSASQRHIATIKEWLRNELGPQYIEGQWTVLPSASPQQNNGYDCGVFLLSTAKAVALGIDPLSYGASDVATLRKKIVAEIMDGGFEGDFNPMAHSELLL